MSQNILRPCRKIDLGPCAPNESLTGGLTHRQHRTVALGDLQPSPGVRRDRRDSATVYFRCFSRYADVGVLNAGPSDFLQFLRAHTNEQGQAEKRKHLRLEFPCPFEKRLALIGIQNCRSLVTDARSLESFAWVF